MLKDDVLKVLEVFDKNSLDEKYQRSVLNNGGVYFNYTWGDPDPNHRNRKLNIFEFAALIDICNTLGIEINVNEMVVRPYEFKYDELVRSVADGKFELKLFKE